MSFQTRLRARREALGLSRAELANKLGVTASAISNYENGISNPKADILYDVFDALQCDANYLFQDEMNEKPDLLWAKPIADAYQKSDESTQRAACAVLKIDHVIPGGGCGGCVVPFVPRLVSAIVYDSPAEAGLPLYIESDYSRMDFPEDEVPPCADFGIRISGESMHPTISDGEIAWVHKQPDINDGEIGIFTLDGGAVCKRARVAPSGRLEALNSDNPNYESITGADLQDVRCVGRVLSSIAPRDSGFDDLRRRLEAAKAAKCDVNGCDMNA